MSKLPARQLRGGAVYLSNDGPVLPDPAVLLLQTHVVKQRQRQRLPIAAQDGLTLAHVSRSHREAAAGVGGVVSNVTERGRTSQLLPGGPEFPAVAWVGGEMKNKGRAECSCLHKLTVHTPVNGL